MKKLQKKHSINTLCKIEFLPGSVIQHLIQLQLILEAQLQLSLIHVILFNKLEIRKRIVRGEAHDQAAFKYGGVTGHSGLFSTSDDVTRFMRIMLNKGKLPELTSRVLPEVVV